MKKGFYDYSIVISVLNTKGGVGKSFIASLLYFKFLLEKYSVALLDADIQNTTLKTLERRARTLENIDNYKGIIGETYSNELDILKVRDLSNEDFMKYVEGLNHRVIIIECGGKDSDRFRKCMYLADFVIIPTEYSDDDVDGIEDTLEIYNTFQKEDIEHINLSVVANKVHPKPSLVEESIKVDIEAIADEYKMPFFNSEIHNLSPYKEAKSYGVAIDELKGWKYRKAKKESNNFYNEVKKWIRKTLKESQKDFQEK